MKALNAKMKIVMALNAELEEWHGVFECRKPQVNGGSECQTETKHGSKRQTKADNYERQAKEDDSERNR